MKVYTQYVNNYNRALTVVHKLTSQNPKFAQFLQVCPFFIIFYNDIV